MTASPAIVERLQDQVPDVLKHIVARKREEVDERKSLAPEQDLAVESASSPRGFLNALRSRAKTGKPALIAEIKKASPSKGLIREDFDPVELARAYEAGGASCLSVLTDRDFFRGDDRYLIEARAAVALPCLRKDFMIDPYQIAEARALNADCVLLMLSILDDETIVELEARALEMGMDALIEVHDVAELERALNLLKSPLIGINNRDLRRMATDLATTEALVGQIPDDKFIVSESGIFTSGDVARLMAAGAPGFLVGESLMRQDDVATATRALLDV